MMDPKEMKDIAVVGVGGLILACMYQTMNILWKRAVYHKLETMDTESLHQDIALNNSFLQLEKHVLGADPTVHTDFIRSIDAADRLVFLRFQLERNAVTATVEDRVSAYLQFDRCESAIASLMKKLEATYKAKDYVQLQRLATNLSDGLALHLKTVMMLTRE